MGHMSSKVRSAERAMNMQTFAEAYSWSQAVLHKVRAHVTAEIATMIINVAARRVCSMLFTWHVDGEVIFLAHVCIRLEPVIMIACLS